MRGIFPLVIILFSAAPANSQIAVDIKLVLAADVSLSMSGAEQILQREGYAAAILSCVDGSVCARIELSFC
jgi:hypothetical protein